MEDGMSIFDLKILRNNFGFFIFDPYQTWNDADPEKYPENWTEEHKGEYRVKSNFRKCQPQNFISNRISFSRNNHAF
jgi:hypothetical protein